MVLPMPKLRVHCLAMSVDGYVAGPDQGLEHPLGVGGPRLHEWQLATRTGREVIVGGTGGETGVDDDFVARGFTGIGATIMGRNMFAPTRGPWDDEWKGWWGDEPPFHHPVFVLTHYPRASIAMEGGTTFHFVTDGIQGAFDRAFDAADGADVRLGGGAATVQQYLRAGLIDDLHVAVVPVLLGRGERLFAGLGNEPPGYECIEFVSSASVAHVRFAPSNRSSA
jgi:dihydrofolate reductase